MLIGYVRVSARAQDPAIQLNALQAVGCDQIFVEKASGTPREQPELTAALACLRPGDTLVVWKLDRLGRFLQQLAEMITGLEARQIGFRSLTEAIDTTAADGRSIPPLFAALAEFERAVFRERIHAGLESARVRGLLSGRLPTLSPDDLRACKALLSDPAITVDQAARRLGITPATFYRYFPGGRSAF